MPPTASTRSFDHLGGDSLTRSYRLLAKDGTLVSYSLLKETGPMIPAFLAMLARLAWWNPLPNGHAASFYNVWAGHTLRPSPLPGPAAHRPHRRPRPACRRHLTAQVAARIPLTQARQAMELAESHTALGKVVLIP